MQLNIKSILVPTDFSEVSINAIGYAADLCKTFQAELTVLHVVESYKTNVALLDLEDIDELIEEKATEKLESIIGSNPKFDDVKFSIKVAHGKIKDTVIDFVSEHGIDLVVMGTTGVSGLTKLSRIFLGSNAYRIIQSSDCPVIAIPENVKDARYENIVLPLDIQKETTQKVDTALIWAKFFQSTVHIISIFDFFDDFQANQEDMNRLLHEVAEKFSDAGVKVKIKSMRYTSVDEAIVDYAGDNDTDLIIIMTRQESRTDKFFLGSSARGVITKSSVPVLSLRPKDENA